MGSLADRQRQSFEDRIKRINKGGANTMGHLLVGSQDGSDGPVAKPIKMRRGKSFGQRLGMAFVNLLLMPVSFVVGGAAMVVGMTVAFHLERADFLSPDGFAGYSELFIAVVFAIAFGGALRLFRGPRRLPLLLGVLAVFVLQDQLLQTYPEAFAALMSDETIVHTTVASFIES